MDTRNFDKFEEEEPWFHDKFANISKNRKTDINFIGYTYKADIENQRCELVSAIEALEKNKSSVYNRKQQCLQEIDNFLSNNENTIRKKTALSKSPFSKAGNLQKALNNMATKEKNPSNNYGNRNSNASKGLDIPLSYKYLSNKNIGLAQQSLWKMNNF